MENKFAALPVWEAAGLPQEGSESPDTFRLKVPGGWIYEVRTSEGSNAACFVPAPPEARP